MKTQITLFFLLFSTFLLAQKPCDYSVNVTDSIGTLKETKSKLMYEQVFGNKSTLVFMSLLSNDGTPILKLQQIVKSKDFISPRCLDANSRIFFQLTNGKVYSLIYGQEAKCDDLLYNEKEQLNSRFLDASFLFVKDDFEDLKKYPILVMRIRFSGETIDYVVQNEINSEVLKEKSNPNQFFINDFNCIAN
jgi:hypothetical protein